MDKDNRQVYYQRVLEDPDALKDIEVDDQTRLLHIMAVSKDPMALKWVKGERDQEVEMLAVISDPWSIQFVRKPWYELVRMAVEKDPRILSLSNMKQWRGDVGLWKYIVTSDDLGDILDCMQEEIPLIWQLWICERMPEMFHRIQTPHEYVVYLAFIKGLIPMVPGNYIMRQVGMLD